MNIGDQVRKRAAEIDEVLPQKSREIERLWDEAKALRSERRELARVIRELDRPANGSQEPAVTDEQIVDAIRSLGRENISSGDVAEYLDVTKRHVARKLRKLVDNGELTGNPETGYTLVAA